MSVTEPGRTRSETTDVRGRTSDTFPHEESRETKPSFMTTEFWAMLIGIAALIVIYNASSDTSFNLWRASLLCVALAAGYFVSRGLAKAGSRDTRWDEGDRNARRY